MTTQRTHRCRHCGDIYYYYPSGCLIDIRLNNPDHCPDCMTVIRKALEATPRKYEFIWVECDDYTVDELIKIEEDRLARAKAEGKLTFRRLTVPLFNMEDPSDHYISGIVTIDRKDYLYSKWSKSGKPSVSVQKEKNIATGEIIEQRPISRDFN